LECLDRRNPARLPRTGIKLFICFDQLMAV
jgi:hypothetical protein